MFQEFLAMYGENIMDLILTACAGILTAFGGWLGLQAKAIYQKFVNDKTKKSVVKTVVKACEQLYKDLGGEEKLAKAQEAIVEMLNEKGISITDLEMRMLIESAVTEFKQNLITESEEK